MFDNSTIMDDPYDDGVDVIDLASIHERSRRSVWDGLKFRLEAPSVDWRKHIGTTDIGASFGVIMLNFLDLGIGNKCFFKSYIHCLLYNLDIQLQRKFVI